MIIIIDSFVLLGKLIKLEFDRSVHWTGQRVHFDPLISMNAFKDKEKV